MMRSTMSRKKLNLLAFTTTLVLLLLLKETKADSSVLILAENSQQVITSTTLEWVPFNKKELDHAVIGSYIVRPKGNFF